MDNAQLVLTGSKETDIYAIGRHIEALVAEQWQSILQTHAAKLQDAYERAGDSAYGTYLDLLFRPVRKDFRQAGLRAAPALPGDFDISREWGNEDESDQQRWMWSTINSPEGSLGTIVTIIFHDHNQFRVPRAPQIIALQETDKEDVVEALSGRSPDFAQAVEFNIWYADYLRSLDGGK